jgi:hypothetical protein
MQKSNRISPPIRRERIRRLKYDTNLKSEWDDKPRNRFLDTLRRCGWDHLGQDHLGADLYQLGGARLAVDEHGLFVFLLENGLSDNLIDACGYHHGFSLWSLYLDGDGDGPPHELDLRTGEIRLYGPYLQ